MTEPKDQDIYSDQSKWISDPGDPDGGYFLQMTWKEVAEDRQEEILRLQEFQKIVVDLDRNENGRHEGDYDVGDPTGVSQGNPKLKTGDILGYDISGRPYVMPERAKRHNPTAWRQS